MKLLSNEQRIAFETLKEARETLHERGRGPGLGPRGIGAHRGGGDFD